MTAFYIVTALVSLVLSVPLLCFPPLRFSGVFFAVLALCTGAMAAIGGFRGSPSPSVRMASRLLFGAGNIVFALFLCSFVVVQLLLYFGGKTDEQSRNADYIIVLGAGINGDRPTRVLQHRLQTALDCANENPDCTLIVCGCQADDEIMPESHVMRRWLIDRGVPAERILIEDKSGSTIENIRFAKKLLPDTDCRTACITNGFHVFRSRRLMANEGLDPCMAAAPIDPPWHPFFCLREYFSIAKLVLTNRW